MSVPFIVVWHQTDDTDHFEVFDEQEDALERYDALCSCANVHSASLCQPLYSTDYDALLPEVLP